LTFSLAWGIMQTKGDLMKHGRQPTFRKPRMLRASGHAPVSNMRVLDRTCMRPFRKQAFLKINQFK